MPVTVTVPVGRVGVCDRDALRGLPTCEFKAVQLLGCGSWHGPAPPPTLPAGSTQAATDAHGACQ